MQSRTLIRLATGTAAAVAALAVTGGAAAGDVVLHPDDRATHGPGVVAQSNGWVAAEQAMRPNDRPTLGPGAIEAAQLDVVLRPDDRADRRLPSDSPVVQPTTRDGFDWVDAGLGSAATLGLVLLLVGASVMRLRQRPQTA
jgi:hypothetical protein